ncbi:hypothetical protein EJ06DRAFT_305176 [Trichodelitschia bisporula]|uniref:Uncharacterized protein n=1 Tax=Trichodelitschia bisporula TaxID=703511 RepID=A0A6G1HHZ3_9PEZI|nr:hypothetical protein EJ06DRAFT_305176 [Trichodelitschia bisporula]
MAILLNHLWKWDRLQYTNETLRVQVTLVILISMATTTRPAALLEPVYAKQGHGELPKVLRYEHVRLSLVRDSERMRQKLVLEINLIFHKGYERNPRP